MSEPPALILRRAAMDALARREHGFAELLEKLSGKFPHFDPETDIQPALERLRAEGLQSDERFIESFVRGRLNRGHGPLKIIAELRQRGIDDSQVRDCFESLDVDWEALALAALSKKFPRGVSSDISARQKAWRFLQQRGFGGDAIQAALSGLS